MNIATGLKARTTSYLEVSSVLEEWRQETIPERDNLYGGTSGDNQAHVIVRATFLDLLFRDESVNTFIQTLVDSTPRDEYLHHLEAVLDEQDAPRSLAANIGDTKITFNHELGELSNSLNLLPADDRYHLSEFLNEFTAFFDNDHLINKIVLDTWDFITQLGFPYKWLLLEIFTIYMGRCFIDGYTWTFQGNLEIEDNEETAALPEGKFNFEVLPGETVHDGITRLRSEVSEFEEEITRFVEKLPNGKSPNKNIASLRKYTQWLFLHKVTGQSIRSISTKSFPGEGDRRKDIYNGIKRAEHLLSLGS